MLITLVTWWALPKLTELKDYAPLFNLLSLIWTMGLACFASLYAWRENKRRAKKELEDQQITQIVKEELAKSNQEKKQMLGTIIDSTNGRYIAMERKLEIEAAKSTDLAVKLLESQSEVVVLSQLLGIRRVKRKGKNDST